MWRSLQKWHAWLLSPLELPYCSQSKIISFNLFQGSYLQNRDFWESILWSQETKSIIWDLTAVLLRSTVRSVWYPQWCSVVVKLFYRDECVRELCFINAVMNSHTTVWWNTETWNRRCYPPLIPCIIGHFFSMPMKIFILPRWKSFSGHVFHSVLTLLSSCGGFCRDELSKTPH